MADPHVDSFLPSPKRAAIERKLRLEQAREITQYGMTFLDDCLRGILRHDLILLGAPSGVGKTDLALAIAARNASFGRNVSYFALEAEPFELERRIKYGVVAGMAYSLVGKPRHVTDDLNYADWLLGNCEHIVGEYEGLANDYFTTNLSTLSTFYRGKHFGIADLEKHVLQVGPVSDLLVIDHLHYVDVADENEARAQGELVKTIRDLALYVGVPVILIAHLRKRDNRARQLVAGLDDFMGSSNIAKIATQAITIERAIGYPSASWSQAPTFVSIQKDRRAGAPPFVALAEYSRTRRAYEQFYTLGRLTAGGSEWEPLPEADVPRWARNHRPMQGEIK